MGKTKNNKWVAEELKREKERAEKWKARAEEAREAYQTLREQGNLMADMFEEQMAVLQQGAAALYNVMQMVHESGHHGYNPLCTATWCKCKEIKKELTEAEEAGILGEHEEQSSIILPGG